jgi:ribonucleotide reductase alpha subunit
MALCSKSKTFLKTLREFIDLAAGRAPFIDQSQSLNIFIAKPDY